MARNTQNPELEIELDGEPYVWWLHRRPQWSSDPSKWRGMAIAVRHREGQREAVLEFPPSPLRSKFGAPQLQASQIPLELVSAAIGSALAVGWEPLSRGKPVQVAVDADGG